MRAPFPPEDPFLSRRSRRGGPLRDARGHGRSRARRGHVRGALLTLLAEAPSNGYGLIKTISERTEGVWRPSPGSVYPTLQQLLDEGLISPAGPDGRDFSLTDAGRAYVEENRAGLDGVWANGSDTMTDRGALVTASTKLAGVLRQIGTAGTPEQRQQATAKVDALRKELYLMLAED